MNKTYQTEAAKHQGVQMATDNAREIIKAQRERIAELEEWNIELDALNVKLMAQIEAAKALSRFQVPIAPKGQTAVWASELDKALANE